MNKQIFIKQQLMSSMIAGAGNKAGNKTSLCRTVIEAERP